jgi:hypothetical protein
MIYGGIVVMETEVTESALGTNARRVANIPEQQFNPLTRYRLTDKLTWLRCPSGIQGHGAPQSRVDTRAPARQSRPEASLL